MKKSSHLILGMLAILLSLSLLFTGCNGEDEPPKVVEEKYRFAAGQAIWSTIDGEEGQIPNAIPVLSENTFNVSGGGVNISFTGVYTEGGGTHNLWGGGTWAYLYASNGKMGIVFTIGNGNRAACIGKTWLDGSNNVNGNTNLSEFIEFDTSNMQEIHNDFAYMPG